MWLAIALLAASNWAFAADSIESKPLQFAKGASSATVKGSLQGYKVIDYRFGAKAGQTLSVTLTSNHTANYFIVLPLGSSTRSFFVRSTSDSEWTSRLPAEGDYTIRVYLSRSAARRDEVAKYTLAVSLDAGAAASAGSPPKGDTKDKGTLCHAVGQVPCSMGKAAVGSSKCEYGVIRGLPGHADVYVTPPGGRRRVLIFADGKVSSEAVGRPLKFDDPHFVSAVERTVKAFCDAGKFCLTVATTGKVARDNLARGFHGSAIYDVSALLAAFSEFVRDAEA